MAQNIVLGLDIGTDSIRGVVAEVTPEKIRLMHGITMPSLGFRRGAMSNNREATTAIRRVLDDIRAFYKPAVKNIYLNIGGSHVKAQVSKGIVAVGKSGAEIYRDDIDRALQASQAHFMATTMDS